MGRLAAPEPLDPSSLLPTPPQAQHESETGQAPGAPLLDVGGMFLVKRPHPGGRQLVKKINEYIN